MNGRDLCSVQQRYQWPDFRSSMHGPQHLEFSVVGQLENFLGLKPVVSVVVSRLEGLILFHVGLEQLGLAWRNPSYQIKIQL